MTRQMTVNVKGDVIRVKVRTSSYGQNFNGYIADVNGKRFRIVELVTIARALELACVAYVKQYR